MSQTSAPLREMVPGRLGLAAEPFQSQTIETKVQPSAKSFFGRAVVADIATGEDAIKHIDTTGQTITGVVQASHALVSSDDGTDPGYEAQEAVAVMNKGRIWVAINEDVAVGDDVYVVHAAGADRGKFRTDNTGADQLTNARWIKGGTAAQGIALLELDVL